MTRTLLLFDGLGGRVDTLLPMLGELYRRPDNHLYFHQVCTVLDAVTAYVGDEARTVLPPGGLALRTWLESPLAPETLTNSVVAGVCVHVLQVCHLQPTRDLVGDQVVAALGHSIGLQAALVAGLRLRRMDRFLEVAAAALRLVALSLVRGHQATDGTTVGPEQAGRYLARDRRGAPPGPMATVTGLHRDDLTALLRRHQDTGGRSLSLSLVNAPTAQVLSGTPAELLDFYFAHQDHFARSGVDWAFLPNTIPFHSDHLLPAVRRVRQDLGFVGPLPGPEQLVLPVYATDTPRNLQHATDLTDEYLHQVLVRPVEWERATAYAIRDARVQRVVDCGPGPGARRYVRECLTTGARNLRFEPVHRSARRREENT
ncbi:hypothetical protein [Micromonospora cathayae]|uniref:Malonyl-CoA:ACP transacylase (MAT) domain-containing protein n=1 Tax=Micromonospora cathayae TaxID=3028804 RepID=A0ABY7ZI54_9ACTN|nr:hypothetical protein [Micromonospora sp. HUAS 3]WDZ82630.1 hypothetical protein PVK37_19370 [Micromonospora sp. HUAS 3]